jgi:hypothetical protein
MNPKKLPLALVFAVGLALAGGLRAQPPTAAQPRTMPVAFPDLPPASPACTNIQRVGFTRIEIIYSRPSARRHTVFGGIIPYTGDIWRTGDNASTKITFSTPVQVGPEATQLPAGTYELFTIPDEKVWTVIFNKGVGGWGKDNYDPRLDVARFKVAPLKLTEPVETFTIDVNDIQDDSATINLSWARVRVPIKVQLDIVNELLARIQVSMDSPMAKRPNTYLQAATFFFDHAPKDLDRALGWVNVGLVNAQPPYSYQLLYLKAKILAKQGDTAGAILAAKQSSTQAIQVEGPATPYFKLNQEIIANPR